MLCVCVSVWCLLETSGQKVKMCVCGCGGMCFSCPCHVHIVCRTLMSVCLSAPPAALLIFSSLSCLLSPLLPSPLPSSPLLPSPPLCFYVSVTLWNMFAVSDVLYITGAILLVHGGTHFLILMNDWSAVFTSSFFFFVAYKSSSTSSVHSRQIRWMKYQCTKEKLCEKQPVLIRKNIKINFVLQLWTHQRKSGYSIWGGAARWCMKPQIPDFLDIELPESSTSSVRTTN